MAATAFNGTINVSPSGVSPFSKPGPLLLQQKSLKFQKPEASLPSGLLEQSPPSHSLALSSNTEPYNPLWFKEKSGKLFLCEVPDSNYFRLWGPQSF